MSDRWGLIINQNVKASIDIQMINQQQIKYSIEELDSDHNINLLFGQTKASNNPPVQHFPKASKKANSSSSEYNFKDEVYSERSYSKVRPKVKTKIVHKTNKKLKKQRNHSYIQMLELKVRKLENEISKLKAINFSNLEYIKKISMSEQIINGFFVGRSQIYERMQTLLDQPEASDTRKEMIKEISSLRYRLGVYGKDRIKAQDYYFNQIIQSFLPECQKYFLYAACKRLDYFSQQFVENGDLKTVTGGEYSWRKEMSEHVNLDAAARKRFYSYQDLIIKEKQKFDQMILKFYEAKKQLCRQAKTIQTLFDSFNEFLDPRRLTTILVTIQKNKYRKEMTLQTLQSFWSYDFHGKDDTIQDEDGNIWKGYTYWA